MFFINKEDNSMVTAEKANATNTIKSKFNDEFEMYLKNQSNQATFNGTELETFSWYQKVLGLRS